jgi:hypothetical protein
MKLKLRRNQKSSMMGKVTFMLDAKAELSDEEADHVKRYKMGKEMLYEKLKMADPGSGLLGVASRIAFSAVNLTITVDDLVKGKHIECKDILEMLAVEQQLREACEMFKRILDCSAHFDGEEIIDFA